MEKYNLINHKNSELPNYPVNGKNISLRLYFSPDRQVCILGQFDNNCAFWLSISALDDIEHNAAIFDFIWGHDHKLVAYWHSVLNREYPQVRDWLTINIRKQHYFPTGEMRYIFPTGGFFRDSGHDNAKSLARDMQTFFAKELDKCANRLVDPLYLTILAKYHEILSSVEGDAYSNYTKMQPLISIIESESYLRLSSDADARKAYLRCVNECSNLYNRYMTAIR